jgi:enoyl-CoA hydratase/carnithine racemase
VATLDKPYIGAINGPAVGAGMDMASMCDIRIAADTARFSMAYVRMALIPGDGGCYFLPRIVGLAKALELIWTGEIVDAQEALRIGYVSEVVPADQLMDRVRQFALKLAKGPAVAMQLAKRLVYRSLETNMSHALELAESAMLVCQTTEDAREGPQAWVEKREPQFKGR